MKTTKPLFDAIRLLVGPLKQSDVDLINRALELCEVDITEGGEPLELLGNEPRGQYDVSPQGVAAMKAHEGLRLTAYPDPGSRDGKPWTIGYGSTGPDVKKGVVWTKEQAEARFLSDLRRFENLVEKLLKVPTSQGQFDAMVSLAYNVGINGFSTSTVLRRHNARDFAGAAAAFIMWRYNDGKEMPGLIARRDDEAARYRGLA